MFSRTNDHIPHSVSLFIIYIHWDSAVIWVKTSYIILYLIELHAGTPYTHIW